MVFHVSMLSEKFFQNCRPLCIITSRFDAFHPILELIGLPIGVHVGLHVAMVVAGLEREKTLSNYNI